MPLLLYSYLLSEMAAPFLASLAILTGALFLGQLLQTFRIIFALGIGWVDFLRLTLYLIPKLMMFSMPLASMLGVILGFSRLGADHEFLALRAVGVKLRQIIAPVIVFALAVMLMAGYSSIVLMPKGLLNMEVLMLKLAREKIDRGIQEQSFSDSMAGIVAYVDRIDQASGQWQGVYLYDGRNPERPLTITAKAASLTADYDSLLLGLHLADGSMDFLDHELSQHVDFKKYSINLPVVIPEAFANNAPTKPAVMSQDQLLAAAKHHGDSPQARIMLIEYHQRLILAVGCFILTIIGLPLAARSRPGVRSTAVPLGLFFFLLYYVLFSFAETLAEQNILPIILTIWTPNLLFFSLAMFVILRMDQESLLGLPLPMTSAKDWLTKLWARPAHRP